MKIFNFIVRHVKVKSAKDAVILLLKLLLIAIIADEIYNAAHILPCRLSSYSPVAGTLSFVISRALFFFIIYISYRLLRRWKRKGVLKKRALIIIITGVLIWILNGSLFFIYYIDGPYWGKVVDADTGEPIAGANVMAMWDFDYEVIKSTSSFADAREAVTDEKGRFFISPARQIWFYPISNMLLRDLYVYKPGYDSHPPHMYRAWSYEEKEKWHEKMININPDYRHDRTIESNYRIIFRIVPNENKVYKPTLVRLNRALSKKEQKRASSFSFMGLGCDRFKTKRFKDIEKRRRP